LPLDLGPGGTLGQITSYTVSGLVAISTATTLAFLGRQGNNWDALGFVDVEQASSVPEPSYLLVGAAFCSLFWTAPAGGADLRERL